MGLDAGSIGAGRPADLMLFHAWSLDQVIARPQSDRLLLKNGCFRAIPLPGYDQLEGGVAGAFA